MGGGTSWGRRQVRGWPGRMPVWKLWVSGLALLSAPVFSYVWHSGPLQRYYLPEIVREAIRQYRPMVGSEVGRYVMVVAESRKGRVPALPADVAPGRTETDRGVLPFALSEDVLKKGWTLQLVPVEQPHVKMRAWLAQQIYGVESLPWVLRPGLLCGLVVLMLGLWVAVPRDRERARVRRDGRLLRGPELVTSEEFNRRNRSDGLIFVEARRTGLLSRRWATVRLPRQVETKHILIMGDTGSGKSSLIRQVLMQVRARGEPAIVYDPAREYVRDFYDAERGDVVLNPLDERMPYWSLGSEVLDEVEALGLAASMYPEQTGENRFFVESARRVFAHLLTMRPTTEELLQWMQAPELDRRVKGTELEAMLDPRAAAQRAGVQASVNMAVTALKLLPTREEARGEWSAAAWSKQRRGWVFLTDTAMTRVALRPLISLWLDMLVLRLMNEGSAAAGQQSPVWFVLDEVASLQRLPQLHTALTEGRKHGHRVVLGFQGRSQLEGRYGKDAETMLSQPATKIFLRTNEAQGAQWISDTIGKAEVERLRESQTDRGAASGRSTQGHTLDRSDETPVMTAQITGLPDLKGFLKLGNLVVPLTLQPVSLEPRAEDLIKRKPRERGSGPGPSGAPPVAPAPEPAQVGGLEHEPFFE